MCANVIRVLEVSTIPHKSCFWPKPNATYLPYTENRRMIAIQPFLWCKHVGPMKSKHQERLIISSWKIKPTEDEVGKNWDSNHWFIWTHGSWIPIEISSQKSSYPLGNKHISWKMMVGKWNVLAAFFVLGDPLVYSLTTWDVSCPSLRMLAGNCDIFSLGKAIPINLHLPLLLVFVGTSQLGGHGSTIGRLQTNASQGCQMLGCFWTWAVVGLLNTVVAICLKYEQDYSAENEHVPWKMMVGMLFYFQMNPLQVTFVRFFWGVLTKRRPTWSSFNRFPVTLR